MRSLSLLAASLATASAGQFNLFKVTGDKGGICLDGTPGAFYYQPGTESTKWIFHFEGGGWCYDAGDCLGRSKGNLGSSKAYPATATSVGGGIASQDCSQNPNFCNWNTVYLKYCDGNSFAGARPDPLNFDGTDLHMRGHYILQEIFEMVVMNNISAPVPYSQATDVVLSGCSAGGLAAYLHTDYVHDNYVPTGAIFHSMPGSGFFLDIPTVAGERVYTEQMQNVWAMQQPGADGVNDRCVTANPGAEWKCNMAQYVYQYIQAPVFPLNSGYDSWQSGCVLTAEPVSIPNNTNVNGNCSAVPGWNACAGNPESCTNAQITTGYNTFYSEFIAAMNTTASGNGNGNNPNGGGSAALVQNGGFITSCHTHCESYGNGWTQFKINGVSMSAAVASWMNGTAPSAYSNFHWDCFYDANGTPRNCNPTCNGAFHVDEYNMMA